LLSEETQQKGKKEKENEAPHQPEKKGGGEVIRSREKIKKLDEIPGRS